MCLSKAQLQKMGLKLLSAQCLPVTFQGWLDDRVECRNALSKLYQLDNMKYMDRTEIPFMVMGERESRYWEWGKK